MTLMALAVPPRIDRTFVDLSLNEPRMTPKKYAACMHHEKSGLSPV